MVSEIMGSNMRTRETILLGENDLRSFHEIIESNGQNGWQSFEQCLIKLMKEGQISEETALLYSVNKSAMRKAVDVAKKTMQGEDHAPSGFRLNVIKVYADPPPIPPRVPAGA